MNNNNFGNVKLESYGKIIGGIVTIVTVAIPTLILGFTCLISGQLILIPFLICLLAVLMIGIVTLLQGLTVRKLVKASESGNYSIAEIDELEKKYNKLNVATLLAGFAYNFGFYLFWFGFLIFADYLIIKDWSESSWLMLAFTSIFWIAGIASLISNLRKKK